MSLSRQHPVSPPGRFSLSNTDSGRGSIISQFSYESVSPRLSTEQGYTHMPQTNPQGAGSSLDDDRGNTFTPLIETNGHQTYETDVPRDENRPALERHKEVSVLRWWYLEIIGGLVALASLAAEVGILLRYDGKPAATWPSTVLTLNGLIAILATVCRAGFMLPVAASLSQARWIRFSGPGQRGYHRLDDFQLFDEASRGSWGSAQLLWRFKFAHIGCLGAALTILSLAFSAFSQQLLTIQINIVPSASQVGAVASSRWVDQVIGNSNSWIPLPATRLAIYDGSMAPNIDLPQVTCSTGNCTWPTIPTVGVCGSCVDLTDEINFIRSPSEFCILALPNGVTLNGYCSSTDSMTVFTLGPGSGRAFGSSDPRVPKRDAPNVIGEFSALGLPGSKTPGATLNDSRAAECGIWYCLQARNVSVQLGELGDVVVDTWSEAITIESAPYPGNVTFVNVPPIFNTEPDAFYGMAAMQMYAMKQYLNRTIVGNVSADGLLDVVWSSTDYAEGVHSGFDDLDTWMDRLTKSMTNNIRQNTTVAPDRGLHQGTAFVSQAIFVVRWEWIVYPVALVFLSTIHLIIEIVRTSRSGASPWKSDALLPICMNIDEEVRDKAVMGVDEPDGIKREIGGYRVRLANVDGELVRFSVRNKE
ncbi:hypothetical protein AAE478_001465 [Parahypoxylon ruwenzoriense]